MSKKKFTKQYKGISTNAIVKKYASVHNALSSYASVKLPVVIDYTADTIDFVRIQLDDYESLKQILCTKSPSYTSDILYNVGRNLAQVHKKLTGTGYIHGDFWPANIFISHNDQIWFDWEPVKIKGEFVDLDSQSELDIAVFLVQSVFIFPKTQWLRYFVSHNYYHAFFLEGYETEKEYDIQIMRRYVRRECKKVMQTIWYQQTSVPKALVKSFFLIWTILIHNRIRKAYISM